MKSTRLEAFSDAVLAIIITIMVLEFEIPHEASWHALEPLVPKFAIYALSFAYIGIYWNNHHHLIQTVERVTGRILWANLHLMFWLSFTPFVTGWLGENELRAETAAAYGVVMLTSAIAYFILLRMILAAHGPNFRLREAIGRDVKGKISPALYATAIIFAFVNPWISIGIYVLVALMWLVPDKRIESIYADERDG